MTVAPVLFDKHRVNIDSTLRDLPLYDYTVPSSALGKEAKSRLDEDDAIPGVLVTHGAGEPRLISRRRMNTILSRPFGQELFLNRPLEHMVAEADGACLHFDETERIDTAGAWAFARSVDAMYEPIVVVGEDGRHRILDVQVLLLAMSHILSLQKEAITRANEELKEAKSRIEYANKQIMEGLDYASVIQRANLPSTAEMERCFADHFVLWQPRDVVGGDFYWLRQVGHRSLLAVVDCTGHGVPGAFMTLIVSSILERIVDADRETDPAAVLARMNVEIREALNKADESCNADDGCEIGLVRIDAAANRLDFAGAGISLLAIPGAETHLDIVRADRIGVGYERTPADYAFGLTSAPLKPGVAYYMATDGVTDLVGGPRRFGFGKRRLRQLLEKHHAAPMDAQRRAAAGALHAWQGAEEQRDDMTLIGFRL